MLELEIHMTEILRVYLSFHLHHSTLTLGTPDLRCRRKSSWQQWVTMRLASTLQKSSTLERLKIAADEEYALSLTRWCPQHHTKGKLEKHKRGTCADSRCLCCRGLCAECFDKEEKEREETLMRSGARNKKRTRVKDRRGGRKSFRGSKDDSSDETPQRGRLKRKSHEPLQVIVSRP